ncbi:MAG TPA: hypothetical protein VIV12_03835 [Streptosporangiaceae bacterium]
MAAIVTAQTVELAAHAGCFAPGRALHGAGSVTGVEPEDFGVSGSVSDADKDFDVWVGIRHRMLVGECDCPDADPQASSEEGLAALAGGRAEATGLCAHAVAVALAAIEHGLPWAPSPNRVHPEPPH